MRGKHVAYGAQMVLEIKTKPSFISRFIEMNVTHNVYFGNEKDFNGRNKVF